MEKDSHILATKNNSVHVFVICICIFMFEMNR